ncbi:MAG TPA: glutathione transferase [Anaeromyxobacter sp.]|nr:glutathione transferase [Anaeromyxobacter sp.]
MPEPVILYGNKDWTSPYVFSCFVVLEEKGVPYRMELLDLASGEHRRPPYEPSSFTGRIPALCHGDVWVAESSAIDEYLEEAFPPPAYPRLYPSVPAARARVRMVQAFLRSDLARLREERPTSTLFAGDSPAPFGAEGRAAAERLTRVAERFLPAGAAHLAGDFSAADADLALMLQRLVHNGDPCPERLAAYARQVFRRPSVRKWLSHTRWKDV